LPPLAQAASQPAAEPDALPATAPGSRPATLPTDPLTWHTKLQDGIDEAQRTGKPILVDFGAAWCGWCRKLDEEIKKPGVQQRLAGWTRVRLDLDKDPEIARQLSVGPIPALRVLTSSGRTVATRDGYLGADELVRWLAEQQPRAATGEALVAEPTDAASAEALVARIADADPVLRETATRRLLKHPDLAAPKVVDTFATGTLAVRLAAIELLQEWEAPLAGMDPWEPATLTKERLEALKKWAASQKKRPATMPATAPAALSSQALTEARRDLAIMLQAATEPEYQASRERLARLGPALLPEIYAAIKTVSSDRDRERLTALRYRVVASEDLVLGWPGGFARLASTVPGTRHAAVEELTTRVKAGDSPLLLELFSDPDPFIRERSLKLLQSVGGKGVNAGLVRLLKDPEPNVRAAVLKQLAAKPTPALDAEIAAFVRSEKDLDLIVHAARVLRESKSATAATCLRELLAHDSWRVRAEAAEGLGKLITDSEGAAAVADQKPAILAAMVKLLDDSDGFVVSRAVIALRDSKHTAALEAMVKAADKRPELAPEVVKALSQSGSSGADHLRKFCVHSSPVVRAAAIAALCESLNGACAPEMKAALQDADTKVRVAATSALLRLFDRKNPGQTFQPDQKAADLEKWLIAFRSGTGWPDWANDAVPLLEKMAASTAPDLANERAAVAVALTALGKDTAASPVLQAAAGSASKEQRFAASQALKWLPWEQRVALYRAISAKASREERGPLIRALVAIPNPGAVPILWEALGAPDADIELVAYAYGDIRQAQLGDRYSSSSGENSIRTKPLIESAVAKAESGTEMQRLAALALLVSISPEEASKTAAKLYTQADLSPAIRTDAFQVMLLTSPEKQSTALAISVLKEPAKNWEHRKLAVRSLALGQQHLNELRNHIYLSYSSSSSRISFGEDSGPEIKPPEGLTAEMIRPMLADTDKEAAACAAYLLVLLGDRSAADTLFAHWREKGKDESMWQGLVYRAVAAIGDDALVPIVEEIYSELAAHNRWGSAELYRTIRQMKGPNALKLRKRMRDEQGADVLR
jgi:HEAT repeat protein/thiol-disulfide isomerase/thioredoxin